VVTNGLALIGRARGALDVLVREMLKFGVVGAVAFVIDLGGYNLLVFGPNLLGLNDKPLTARIISATVATLVAWLGNRMWTFRHRRNRQASHELALYLLFNGIAMVISVACLGISRYVMGLETPLADNVTNIFGIVLGTLFRFWSYRKWVFAGVLEEDEQDPLALRDAPAEPDRAGLDRAGLDRAELDGAELDGSVRLDRSARNV
jgi:putative flippase GtrA